VLLVAAHLPLYRRLLHLALGLRLLELQRLSTSLSERAAAVAVAAAVVVLVDIELEQDYQLPLELITRLPLVLVALVDQQHLRTELLEEIQYFLLSLQMVVDMAAQPAQVAVMVALVVVQEGTLLVEQALV
jgi:hypothetical protein